MDNRLKQRLIGAAVLVALAVIIVPELVKRPVEPGRPVVSTDIPPRTTQGPQERSVTISLPPTIGAPASVAPPPDSARESMPPSAAGQPQATPAEPRPAARAESLAPEQTVEVAPPAAPSVESGMPLPPVAPGKPPSPVTAKPAEPYRSASAEVKPPPLKPAAPERSTGPAVTAQAPNPIELPKIELIGRASSGPASSAASSPPQAAAGSWVVQAGSFTLQENASSLRDTLRARNFPAAVQRTVIDGRALFRVRVGPLATRAEGEKVRERMQREAGVSGRVLSADEE